ncbi:MAG: hypothetical protein ABSB49_11325 [Polyangia bacterium]
MRPTSGLRLAGVAAVLALAGCGSGSYPVLPPGVGEPDAGIGSRGMQVATDASPAEVAAVLAARGDALAEGGALALSPRLAVTILWPAPGEDGDGGVVDASGDDASGDGGPAIPIINAALRFAPEVSVDVESRGGDPTGEVISSVMASLLGANSASPVAAAALNMTQLNVLPETASKSYIYAGTPLDLGKVPSGYYTLVVTATTTGGTTASAQISVYVDSGPSITFLAPAAGSYVKGSVLVTAVVDDAQAGVKSVAFSVGQVALAPAVIANSGVQYTATIDCNSFNPPLDGAHVVTVTAVNGNDVTAVATLPLNVDNAGPTISATLPASGDLIGKVIDISATVTDPAGVMAGSVVAVVANGDIKFQVVLVQNAQGIYQGSFDTTQLPSYAVYPSISFSAEDVLGNQSSTGYLVSLDNAPPIMDLDPPADVRLVETMGTCSLPFDPQTGPTGPDCSYTCSWPFDPVGPDAVNDGAVVSQVFTVRARIEDQGNNPLTGQLDYVPTAGVDPATVKVLILGDTSQPLVVDTSDPPDGICDDINPALLSSASAQSSPELQSIDMVALAADDGAGDFSPEPNAPCPTGSATSPPSPLCATAYSPLQRSYLTYSLGYSVDKLPSIWTLGPVVSDGLECAGRQYDASNNLNDGWACLAVVAADKLGNKQVSRPIRVCVAAKPGSTACSASAMGGATLASVTVPGSSGGASGGASGSAQAISFTTVTPLVGVAGAALSAGDKVAFSGVTPAGFLNGTHTVAPVDGSGMSFTVTDISPSSSEVLRFIPFSSQPVAGVAVPAAKLPSCTGTVVKQANGQPPTVDATKPCTSWATFPEAEFEL